MYYFFIYLVNGNIIHNSIPQTKEACNERVKQYLHQCDLWGNEVEKIVYTCVD